MIDSPVELAPFVKMDAVELRTDAQRRNGAAVDDSSAAFGDSTDAEFGVAARAKLAGDEHLQRHSERAGDFTGNGNAAAR
jgi:hypothetical protein